MSKPNNDREHAAQRRLDQLRHEAGGALKGDEVRKRHGLDPGQTYADPPLDYRLTTRNILLQVLAVALFAAVLLFMFDLFFAGGSIMLGKLGL